MAQAGPDGPSSGISGYPQNAQGAQSPRAHPPGQRRRRPFLLGRPPTLARSSPGALLPHRSHPGPAPRRCRSPDPAPRTCAFPRSGALAAPRSPAHGSPAGPAPRTCSRGAPPNCLPGPAPCARASSPPSFTLPGTSAPPAPDPRTPGSRPGPGAGHPQARPGPASRTEAPPRLRRPSGSRPPHLQLPQARPQGPPRPAPPAAPLTAALPAAAVPAGHLDAGRSGCRRFLMALGAAQRQRRLRLEAGAAPSRARDGPGAAGARADAGAEPVPSRSRNRPLQGLSGGPLIQSARGARTAPQPVRCRGGDTQIGRLVVSVRSRCIRGPPGPRPPRSSADALSACRDAALPAHSARRPPPATPISCLEIAAHLIPHTAVQASPTIPPKSLPGIYRFQQKWFFERDIALVPILHSWEVGTEPRTSEPEETSEILGSHTFYSWAKLGPTR